MKTTTFHYFFAPLILACILFMSEFLHSQTKFQKSIGGIYDENFYSIIQTTGGGYALAGNTTSFGAGNSDMFFVKLDAYGLLQWSKAIGGPGSDYSYSVIQTLDGGYAMAGNTLSFGTGGSDMYIAKFDASGLLQWSKTIGSAGAEESYSITQTKDGGYALAGYTTSSGAGNSDMIIVKLESTGSLQWSKTIGGMSGEYAYSIIRTNDGGYALAGITQSFGAGGIDVYIAKLDASGLLQWSRAIGGPGNDYAYSIIQTADFGYAVGGSYYMPQNGLYSMYIVKLNSSGSLLWSQTVCGINEETGNSIVQASDGGYVLAGNTYSIPGHYNKFIAKIDASGLLQWTNAVMAIGNDYGSSIILTTDGGYALTGRTNDYGEGGWDGFMVKADANGFTCGNSTPFPCSNCNPVSGETIPISIVNSQTMVITTPNSTVSTGGTTSNICSIVGIENENEISVDFSLHQNYPNPFNPSTTISFDLPKPSMVRLGVYDLSGKVVRVLVNENLNAGRYSYDFDGSNLSSGVYFYRITADGINEVKKMMLVK